MPTESTRDRRPELLVSLILVLVTVALYWPVRHYDFVEYDDPDYVFENPTVCSGISWNNLAWAVVDAHAWNWHPVTWISHMLDCQLFGVQPGAHHGINVLLHAASSAILFLVLRGMTGAFWRSAIVAALFAWHPLRVESVAWIAERKDVLSGLFFMLTIWSYTKYAFSKMEGKWPTPGIQGAELPNRHPSDSAGRLAPRSWYAATLVFFVLGLLSKPMLVTVPFVLLLLDLWPLGRVSKAPNQPGGLLAWGGILGEKVPFFLLSAAVALITVLAQHGTMVPLRDEATVTRVGTVFVGYFLYLQKTLWPQDLTVLYLRPDHVPLIPLILGLFIVVGISILAIRNFRTSPYLAVGWFWFLGMLVPVNGLAQTGLQSMADRYNYLPGIGLAILAVWGLHQLAGATLSASCRRAIPAALASAALILCANATRNQLRYWQNTKTLMAHALEIDPNNYVAHQDLGRYYAKLGKIELARAHHQKVLELDPSLSGASKK